MLMAEWLQCDKAVHEKMTELSALREKRRVLSEQLLASPSELDKSLARIVTRRVYAPLTYGLLDEVLTEVLSDSELVQELLDHVRSARASEVVNEIRRTRTTRSRRSTKHFEKKTKKIDLKVPRHIMCAPRTCPNEP